MDPDRKSLLLPGIKELVAASPVEALRPGAKGAAYDGALLGRPWEFKLEDVNCPKMYLWHGEQGHEVPASVGRAVAEKLAQCQATHYPEEGHISLSVHRAQDILSALIN